MKLSVLVPTYRRPTFLARCLGALERQTRPPDQVLVVTRESDAETIAFLEHLLSPLPLEIARVDEPGQVAALNAGLDMASGDVVAITDDDAAPHRDWLQRIEKHFADDPDVAGVGGRDWLHNGPLNRDVRTVGTIQWFGRRIGNHHRGTGPARYVDVLKGANMSYRMSAIRALRFDSRLLGSGAQVHNDMCFSLRLRTCGRQLLYDPAVGVDHFTAERFDDDARVTRSREAIANEAHNETLGILEYLPRSRWVVFLLWSALIGHRGLPGVLQCVRLAALGQPAWAALTPVLSGRYLGLRAVLVAHHPKRPPEAKSALTSSGRQLTAKP